MTRTHIMLHHSLTEDSQTVSWRAIREYHMHTNGWRDIGYHYGVEKVSLEYEALVGRPEDQIAAACKEGQMNEAAIHICCVGNYDAILPNGDMLLVLTRRLLLPIMHRYGIPPERIVGHRDYAPYKSCPGNLFDIEAVRRLVR